ncbi:hypothetical protein LINGRAPRIM_LOCUS2083 [Linum grandiflorum]
MALPIGISANLNSLRPPLCWVQSVSSSHPLPTQFFSPVPKAVTVGFNLNLSVKNKSLSRPSSAQGNPSELDEESKFVPLNADDPVFGPPALLLLGFEVEEAAKIQKLLQEMGGEFLQLVFCTEDMVSRSLWKAINTAQPNLKALKVDKSLPRICFISGLSGEETIMFIDAFPEAGLEPAVFAALVPNSADKPIYELVEEIMADHQMMVCTNPSSTLLFS